MLCGVTMNAIRSVLDADHLPYELADDHLRCRTLSPGGEWVVVAQWSDTQLAVYCVCSLNVPPARRAAVMELVTRANYGLRLGCFELDLDDGEVRFRASLDFEGIEPSSSTSVALARSLLYTSVATMGRYAPALVDVVDGADAKAALAPIEGAR